ncbi:MAG: hypothetical protein AB8E82_20655 [Aureispira sp.]
MKNAKLIINDIVLKKGCANVVEAFYNSSQEFYLVLVVKLEDDTVKMLLDDPEDWSGQLIEMGYNNTRVFRSRTYQLKANIDFELQFYLVKLLGEWPDLKQLSETTNYSVLVEELSEHTLIATKEINLKTSVTPILVSLNNEMLRGTLLILKKGHKMQLPPKYLPAVFADWSAFKDTRPSDLKLVDYIYETPPGKVPKVVSSVHGKIQTLVLYYPSMQEVEEERVFCYQGFLLELISKMEGGRRRFIIAVEDHYNLPVSLDKALKKTAQEANHLLEIISITYRKRNLSSWAQDAFLPIQFEDDAGQTTTYLVESTAAINYYYKGSVEALDKAYKGSQEFVHYETKLPFVGGNVLSGDDFLLVGLHGSSKVLTKAGSDWLGKNLILLSSKPTPFIREWGKRRKTSDGVLNYYQSSAADQTLFHLDLFITLAGKGLRRNTIEYIVVGEPVLGFDGLEAAPEDVRAIATRLLEETTQAIEEIIEQIQQGMEAIGKRYKIIRNPLPLTYYDQIEEKDSQPTSTRYWCWASYNNCLVEQYEQEGDWIRSVFLPSYGGHNSNYSRYSDKYGSWRDLERFDKQNKTLWEEKLDYDVVLLEQDFNPFIRYQGSLNCLTNCIERKL